jgi:hypothetical protein
VRRQVRSCAVMNFTATAPCGQAPTH